MSNRSKSFSSGRGGGYDTVAVRFAGPEDEAAIRRVAALDSKDVPVGPTLVAEADGDVIAALAIDSGEAAADPFRWTADVVALMKLRAAQLDSAGTFALPSGGGQAVQPLRTQLT
jgi:hypothetical protein